jgi:methylenetetrahydrofolate--tRNA-(uracil-5-)-methyltransferase
MNVNFGLFPPINDIKYKDENGKSLRGKDKTKFRKKLLSIRALKDIDQWLSHHYIS